MTLLIFNLPAHNALAKEQFFSFSKISTSAIMGRESSPNKVTSESSMAEEDTVTSTQKPIKFSICLLD